MRLFHSVLFFCISFTSLFSATIVLDTTENYEKGEQYSYSPGDTILLKAGRRPYLSLQNFNGAAGKPIVVINQGGQVRIGRKHVYGLNIVNCNHIKISGTGVAGFKYGIVVDGATGNGVSFSELSSDCEIEHVEICSTGFAGIMAKKDYSGNPPQPLPVFDRLFIHDTYIHDVGGEGMYLGETKSPGMEFRHVHVFNNTVCRTGLDLIQIANMSTDVQVHHNILYRGGLKNINFQQNGFQIGDNCVGSVYNNIIMHCPANGCIVLGSGAIRIYNNYIQGFSLFGMFIDNRLFSIPDSSIDIYDNYLCDIASDNSFFRVYNEINRVNFRGNRLDGNNGLVTWASGAGAGNCTFADTLRTSFPRISFVDTARDDFRLPADSPYRGIGLIDTLMVNTKRPHSTRIAGSRAIRLPHSIVTLNGQTRIVGNRNLKSVISSGQLSRGVYLVVSHDGTVLSKVVNVSIPR